MKKSIYVETKATQSRHSSTVTKTRTSVAVETKTHQQTAGLQNLLSTLIKTNKHL